jgi:regulatory protein SWI5
MGSEIGYDSSYYSPTSSALSREMSQDISPELANLPLFEDAQSPVNSDSATLLPTSSNAPDPSGSGPASPVRDTPSPGSLSNLDLDAAVTETGITIDDIATFIGGPDPSDGKWLCFYPECGKRFGRKENIKSHVQTHLGDRQYQCPHCKKCFVRQHDLKRHAKIHSGIKPYLCQCGNSFARHDALTRHRQRGMCIGAFEGVVKKVVKRGRPRKSRPEAEARANKARRTRKKVQEMSSASSSSGQSDSSRAHSPPSFGDISDKAAETIQQGFPALSQSLIMAELRYTPPQSPRPYGGDCVSPQQMQKHHSPSAFESLSPSKRCSIASIPEEGISMLPSQPNSPAKSAVSQYNSPPELCLSSSSPAPSKFFDFDNEQTSLDSQVVCIGNDIIKTDVDELNDQVGDMFLTSFNPETSLSMTALERDPNLLLMDKFEEAFSVDSGDGGMLMDGDDVFFGSP